MAFDPWPFVYFRCCVPIQIVQRQPLLPNHNLVWFENAASHAASPPDSKIAPTFAFGCVVVFESKGFWVHSSLEELDLSTFGEDQFGQSQELVAQVSKQSCLLRSRVLLVQYLV